MPCGCTTYNCLEAWVNPCNAGTAIGIEATQTGTWTMRIEFNGAWKEFGVSVTEGDEISILTALLNENYTHELRVYNLASALFGCYHLKTHYTADVEDSPTPPIDGSWEWGEISASGNTVTSDLFTGELAPIMWFDSNDLRWEAAGIIQDPETGELDLTSIGGFTGTISFQYRNLTS